MIKPECFTKEWCVQVAQKLDYKDTQIIEKVVRALSLLEMLIQSGCPFHFKGGTATMLLLGKCGAAVCVLNNRDFFVISQSIIMKVL